MANNTSVPFPSWPGLPGLVPGIHEGTLLAERDEMLRQMRDECHATRIAHQLNKSGTVRTGGCFDERKTLCVRQREATFPGRFTRRAQSAPPAPVRTVCHGDEHRRVVRRCRSHTRQRHHPGQSHVPGATYVFAVDWPEGTAQGW